MSDPILLLVDLLGRWPERLVSKPDRALVEDSLALLEFLGDARSVVDVGSGGGLPGLPLKLAKPELQLTLIESNRRKAAFIVHAAAALKLSEVEVVAVRAEDAGRDPNLREHFDAAVARALAQLPVLVELCLPLVRVGGRLLAMKASTDAELSSAGTAIQLLGGELVDVAAAPSDARQRGRVVIIEKVRPTPAAYPRRAGLPARRPIS